LSSGYSSELILKKIEREVGKRKKKKREKRKKRYRNSYHPLPDNIKTLAVIPQLSLGAYCKGFYRVSVYYWVELLP
jgi:hypothetical protein